MRPAALLLALAAAGCAAAPPRLPPEPAAPLPVEGGEWGYGPGDQPGARRSWEDIGRVYGTFMPYAWRASGSGDAVVRDVPVRFDEADDPDDGDLSFGGRAEMYSERVGFFLDGFYAKVAADDSGTEFDDRHFVLDLGAAMRMTGGDPWQGMAERGAVDVEVDGLALIRSHWVSMEASPPGSFTPADHDAFWFDLAVGARAAVVFLGRISVYGKIDGGGFALNQWQSWTWSGELGAKVRILDGLSAMAAWRWFESHYQDGVPDEVVTPFGTDHIDSERTIRQQGPWVGVVLEF